METRWMDLELKLQRAHQDKRKEKGLGISAYSPEASLLPMDIAGLTKQSCKRSLQRLARTKSKLNYHWNCIHKKGWARKGTKRTWRGT